MSDERPEDEPTPESEEIRVPGDAFAAADDDAADLDTLLHFLKESRGFDFTGYKRPSLTRRIQKRMQEVNVGSYAEYRTVLERNSDEYASLFNTILINVTAFLRDPDAWEFLSTEVVPRAVAAVEQRGGHLRAWSAGCASGEEAFSLAVILLDVLGPERFREVVKIYATDVDEEALRDARQGRFPMRTLVDAFGEERVQRYFEPSDSSWMLRPDLRRSVIFGRHDLVQDPPISRLDLIVCRNTLMYFNSDVQRRILANFHFALNDTGYLFLGKSEALVTRTNLFSPVDPRRHVFLKLTTASSPRPTRPTVAAGPIVAKEAAPPATALVAEAAFEVAFAPQIVVNRQGVVLMANRMARAAFGIATDQLGRPISDLGVSFRPADLRTPIEQVLTDRRPVTLLDITHRPPGGDVAHYDILVLPVERAGSIVGVLVQFDDVTRFRQLREDLGNSQRDLEMAYEELQSAVEELETTNEELQSTNEELETTNEELHSTNEELETMNEELHSTNEELETVNGELRQRTSELAERNVFLQSILRSLRAGVVVLAADMAVQAWNREAEQLWGLRADEVEGMHFLNLDIGLPVDTLRAPIRRCLSGETPQERLILTAINRRGREIDCVVTISPLVGEGTISGAIVLMEEAVPDDRAAG